MDANNYGYKPDKAIGVTISVHTGSPDMVCNITPNWGYQYVVMALTIVYIKLLMNSFSN